jgi:vancomycin permeability regulator SanA
VGLGLFGGCVAWVRAPARHRILNEHNVPAVPVALVLGAQVYPSGWPSAFLRARLDLAKRLLDAGKVEVLLVSGASDAPEYDEPKAMRTYLVGSGVPTDRIVEDPHGLDTYDSCVRAQQVYGLDAVVLVSQSYHLPRAVGTARRLGLTAYGVGDETVRSRHEPWVSGSIRDQVACVKAVWDLLSRRKPVLDGPDSAVREALSLARR